MRHTCVSPDETRKSGNPGNHAEQRPDYLPNKPLQLYSGHTLHDRRQND